MLRISVTVVCPRCDLEEPRDIEIFNEVCLFSSTNEELEKTLEAVHYDFRKHHISNCEGKNHIRN